MTYDGHDGTDFRVPTRAARLRGVPVVAAAAGVVARTRDGVPDSAPGDGRSEKVRGRECGNGVVVEHPGGWETQYCHLANGSLRVKAGDQVSAGTVLGAIGQSGAADFPHLHLGVRYRGAQVDPFSWGAPSTACGGGEMLWSKAAQRSLAYRSPEIINAGFADRALTMEDIEADAPAPPGPESRAIVAFVRVIGLQKGDEQVLELFAPGGRLLASNHAPGLERDMAQRMIFVGVKRPPTDWPRGDYEARFQVIRAGAATATLRITTEIR